MPNLRYGLRGAGPSFGIVTEFLYKVYPHPETLSCVVLVYIESGYDLQRLVDAGQHGRYGITLMHPMVYRRYVNQTQFFDRESKELLRCMMDQLVQKD